MKTKNRSNHPLHKSNAQKQAIIFIFLTKPITLYYLCKSFNVKYIEEQSIQSYIIQQIYHKTYINKASIMNTYENQIFKIPVESQDYPQTSDFIIKSIEGIIENSIQEGKNKIILNTNLRNGLPMENINKIAGPIVEAWAGELFESIALENGNKWNLVHSEACSRLGMADIILQFKKSTTFGSVVTANVDSKATAEDLENSGKSPNITSFARIRSAYVDDADFIFIILSLKHKVFCQKNLQTGLMDGIMEVVKYNAYDMKYISDPDLSYNPALGTGQLQIRDIHYVTLKKRTTWEFCQLLDFKYLSSTKRTFEDWFILAQQNGWIK